MSDNVSKQISTDDLRRMDGQDGLVLQGCGGDPQEWVGEQAELFRSFLLIPFGRLDASSSIISTARSVLIDMITKFLSVYFSAY